MSIGNREFTFGDTPCAVAVRSLGAGAVSASLARTAHRDE